MEPQGKPDFEMAMKRIDAWFAVDLQLHELEPFIAATKPKGLYLCIAAEEKLQPEILKRLEQW